MGGGWGAKMTEDGMSSTVCLNDGDTHNSPVEQMESKFPLLFESHSLRQDSGGPGRYRGGLGAEQVIQARTPLTVNLAVDRVHCAPWGLAGGKEGMGNQVALRLDGEDAGELPNAKVHSQRLKPGDAFTLRAGGGGGFGDPRLREAEKVADDVKQGYVSAAIARDVYGVALTEAGTVDATATAALRAQLAIAAE
jgi:N-methylhydantoinase B